MEGSGFWRVSSQAFDFIQQDQRIQHFGIKAVPKVTLGHPLEERGLHFGQFWRESAVREPVEVRIFGSDHFQTQLRELVEIHILRNAQLLSAASFSSVKMASLPRIFFI